MKGPEYKPLFKTHCYSCGGELITKKVQKKRVAGIFSPRWQWEIDAVCSSCGSDSGAAVASLMPYHPQSLIMRGLRSFRGLIRSISPVNRSHKRPVGLSGIEDIRCRVSEYRGPDGNMDLAKLLAAIPFEAYGMTDHPLGLRLTSPGYGKTGEVIDRLNFQYVTGGLHSGTRTPGERIIDIEQGPMGERYRDPEADLSSIRGLVDSDRDFYRDWNLKRIECSPKREATVRVNGTDAMVELASWHEPQQVTLAHMNIGDHPMRVTSLNLSEEELLQCLRTLTVLQEDRTALTQHIQDYNRASQELRALWGAGATDSPK